MRVFRLGSVLVIVAVVYLSLPNRPTVAQEPKKEPPKTIASVTESGAYHRFDRESFAVRVHRKSFSNGDVVLFIETKITYGDKTFFYNITPESARDLLALNRTGQEKSRNLTLAPNVAGARLDWAAKGYLSEDFELFSNWPLGDWQWAPDVTLKSIIPAFEQAVKDADALKANKLVTPW